MTAPIPTNLVFMKTVTAEEVKQAQSFISHYSLRKNCSHCGTIRMWTCHSLAFSLEHKLWKVKEIVCSICERIEWAL